MSLVVQQLRHCTFSAGSPGSVPGQGMRSRVLQLTSSQTAATDPQILREAASIKDPTRCSQHGLSQIHKCIQTNMKARKRHFSPDIQKLKASITSVLHY